MSFLLVLLSITSIYAFSPGVFIPKRARIHKLQPLHSTEARNGNNAPMFTSLNQTLMEVPPITTSISPNGATVVNTDESTTSETSEQAIPQSPPRNNKAAIVLNVNARSVTEDLCEIANEVFGESNVFLTSTEEEAKQAASRIVQEHYSVVIPVGGDGTLSTLMNIMVHDVMRQTPSINTVNDAMKQLPLVGYIPLGTGNGVGSVVGCKGLPGGIRSFLPGAKRRKRRELKNLFQQLQNVAQDSSSCSNYEVVELPMMQVAFDKQDELCFFAGVGFDSLMLNDFKQIKAWSKRTGVLTKVLSSVTGYCVALVVKTLPKCVLKGKHNIQVNVTTRHPEETTWIDHRRGDVMRRVTCGNLYEGTTGILAAGTSPFYGGGLRLFPFARMTLDKMHLRLGRIHPLVGFINIPKIFAGSYRDTSDRFGCIDFVGTDFDVKVTSEGDEKGFPFQHSGESVGHTDSFRLSVVKEPVRFVSFMQKSWKRNGDKSEQ